jgi:IS30 family transposase
MDPRSKHLSREERGVIFSGPGRGSRPRAIGPPPGRPASTICRELAGDRAVALAALRRRGARRTRGRRRRRLVEGRATCRFSHDRPVHRCGSSGQIAQGLRLMKPDVPSARVSPETIYTAICAQPRGGLKAAMVECLIVSSTVRSFLSSTGESALRHQDLDGKAVGVLRSASKPNRITTC